MYAWMGKILSVDLSSGKIEKLPLNDDLRLNYLGGRGINSKLCYDMVKPGIDPLGPENVLLFGSGTLVGTIAPSAARMTITAKSPLSGILGDSNVGGNFSRELKRAGYDHIIFTGKATSPVYLWIDDDHVELKSAGHLWGKTVSDTEDIIWNETKDPAVKIASIGPGGENMVRFACVMCDSYSAAGRTGMGAVMGSKNLKAIAVRGTSGIKVAKPKPYMEAAKRLQDRIIDNPQYRGLAEYGTPCFLRGWYKEGSVSIKNAQTNVWPEVQGLFHRVWKNNYYIDRAVACTGCPRHCKHPWIVREGPYAGIRGGNIEYMTICSFGLGCLINDPAAICQFTHMCDNYGLDVSDMGGILSAAMEWYENGLVSKEDLDGIDLVWGNIEGCVKLIDQTARREGFGNILAEGPVLAAKKVGKGAEERLAQYSKGVAMYGDDVRGYKGYALNLATSTRGADHLRGMPGPEVLGRAMSPVSREAVKEKFGTADVLSPRSYNKAALLVYHQNLCVIADSLELCKFNSEWVVEEIGMRELAELFSLATGIDMDEKGMTVIANRVYSLERAFLIREGITRKDDALLGRRGSDPIPNGPQQGEGIDPAKFEKMLSEYYTLRDWDVSTGIPTANGLKQLGLGTVAAELKKMGKLPSTGT